MLESIGLFFVRLWNQIVGVFGAVNPVSSIVDIVLLTLVFYFVLRLVRDSRAEQLLKGLLVLFIAYMLANWFHLEAIAFVLRLLFGNAIILLVVIFQPELRRMLEKVGHTSHIQLGSLNSKEEKDRQTKKAIEDVCAACEVLQHQKMGALIVFERNTMLGDIAATGTPLDAGCSAELIGNVFFNKAPLHDGALIIREGRLLAAGCILPLTDQLELSSELGTRHRAAVGMSENSDSLVVVVSEETGILSLAQGGTLRRHLNPESLAEALTAELVPPEAIAKAHRWFKRKEKKGEDQ